MEIPGVDKTDDIHDQSFQFTCTLLRKDLEISTPRVFDIETWAFAGFFVRDFENTVRSVEYESGTLTALSGTVESSALSVNAIVITLSEILHRLRGELNWLTSTPLMWSANSSGH